MSESPQSIAEQSIATLYARDRASQMLGMRITEAAPGLARVTMTVRPDMCNGHLICHGGLIFTLADSAFAFACNSYNRNTVAAGATIDFLTPVRLGDELTAEARELWRPGRSGLYEITVTNQRGERVALFRGRSHEVSGVVMSEAPSPSPWPSPPGRGRGDIKRVRMNTAYICDAIRSPIGSFGGALAPVRADDLAAHVLRALMARQTKLDPAAIDDVILGCANQAGEDNRNVARMALLLAGLPITVPGETVNRLCASGMSAAVGAGRAIAAGHGDVFIAGGVEHMTRGPWIISKTSTPYGRDAQMFDSSFGWRFVNPLMKEKYGVDAMGETAENLLETNKISREDQDRFAVASQQKAKAAQARGRFKQEIAGFSIPQKKGDPKVIDTDEFPKPDTTMDGLAKLKPAFRKDGSVTAGNASGLNDGAVALLIASDAGIKQQGLKPLARIVTSAVVGVEPRIMGIGPVNATKLALKRAGLSLDQMDILEFNEAFAAQVLSCTRSLGLEDTDSRINPNGGAIALGHPLGMTGARLLQTAALELHEQNKRYALCTMCVGVGQGYATILERT